MIMEEDPRFRHLKRKIAIFAVGALALIAFVVVLIGKENDLFTSKYNLRFTVPKGTGFTRGMPVKLSGFRIGRVSSIALNEAATVNIVLQIDKKYRQWIRRDSRARLLKEGLVGESIVEVSVGSAEQPVLGENEVIAFEKTRGLDELADDIAEKVKPVLIEVRDIIAYVNDPNGDIKQSLRNMHALSGNLEVTRRQADLLLLEARGDMGTLSVKMNKVLDDASVTMHKAGTTVDQLDRKLPALLEKTENALKHMEKIGGDVGEVTGRNLPKVTRMVESSQHALDSTNEVLDAVKGMWPISSRMKQPEEKLLVPGDSHE